MLLSFSRASRFALAEWEGQRPSAVNMIEIEVDSMAKKLLIPTVGDQSTFQRKILGRRNVSSRSGFRSENGYIVNSVICTETALCSIRMVFVCLNTCAMRNSARFYVRGTHLCIQVLILVV